MDYAETYITEIDNDGSQNGLILWKYV